MSRLKKPAAYLGVAVLSAAGALAGNGLLRDTQFARARDAVEAARSQLATADVGEMSAVFRNVGKVMDPSVVNIAVTKGAKTGRRALPFDDETLRRFFPDRDRTANPTCPTGSATGPGRTTCPARASAPGPA
jgi:S1-C subfamily serine protease